MAMADNDWKKRLGMVYSTNADYQFTTEDEEAEVETLPKGQQKLRVNIERAGRKGKTVTLVKGFVGSDDDLKELGRMLKTKLSTGGSTKDGELVIQGDVRQKVLELLLSEGYSNSK
jgi:translation initiation factor 1